MAALIPFNYRKNDLSPSSIFNMMDDFFSDALPLSRSLMNDTFKVDVKEIEGAYTIEAEMPGIQKEEISLSLHDDRLSIGIQRKEETKTDNENYLHRERRYSSMQRTLYLADANPEDVQAQLIDGILKITVQKAPKPSNAKQIEIK